MFGFGKPSVRKLKSLALSIVEQQRRIEQNSAWPDWKATMLALDEAESLIRSQPMKNGRDTYAHKLLTALSLLQSEYLGNEFNDEYHSAKATIRSVVRSIAQRFEHYGIKTS